MPITNFAREKVLKAVLLGVNITAPSTVYWGLHTDDPGPTGALNELTGNGYTRPSKTTGTTNFLNPADSGAVELIGNKTNVVFGAATTASWAQAFYWSLWDGATGSDNCWWTGLLVPSITVLLGATYTWTGHATDPTQSGFQLTLG